jgi:outer membrane protein
MKTSTPLLLLSIALLSFNVQAELKAGFINSALILQQAPQAISAVEKMKKEFQGRENDLRALAEETQKQEDNLNKDGAIMSAEQRKKIESEIMEKKRKIRFDAQSLKEDVDLRRKQEIQSLRTSITTVINKYAEDHKFDLIFTEGVAYAAEKVDITDEILKELNK